MDTKYWKAIREFCVSCTIPIIVENEEKAGIHGSGLLFENNSNLYLITAAHVAHMVENHPDVIGIPTGKINSQTLTFKDCEMIYASKDKERELCDVALIILTKNKYICEALRENYCSIGIGNIGKFHSTSNKILLAGYPSELTNSLPNHKVHSNFFMFETALFQGEIDKSVETNPSCDIFLEYGKNIIDENGKIIKSPKLEGISGGTIWGINYSSINEKFWSPEKAIKIIAVDRSYSTNFNWVRGVKWNAVAHLFSKCDPLTRKNILDVL